MKHGVNMCVCQCVTSWPDAGQVVPTHGVSGNMHALPLGSLSL